MSASSTRMAASLWGTATATAPEMAGARAVLLLLPPLLLLPLGAQDEQLLQALASSAPPPCCCSGEGLLLLPAAAQGMALHATALRPSSRRAKRGTTGP